MDDGLLASWRAAYAEPVGSGWDLTEVESSFSRQDPPWSYDDLARDLLRAGGAVLDLGTGGGEKLLGLLASLQSGPGAHHLDLHATEGWPPNVEPARRALAAVGVPVAEHDAERGDRLPWPDDRFDVVLNRHEAYVASDIARVLRPGGTFLTQQVDGHNLDDLAAHLGAGPAYPAITLAVLRDEAERAGLVVERAEDWAGTLDVPDVTDLLAWLRVMPWQLPADFTVDGYAEELMALHHRAEAGRLVLTERRFLLQCRQPD